MRLGESLPKPDGEYDLTIGQMAENLAALPLTGTERLLHPLRSERLNNSGKTIGRSGHYFERIAIAEVLSIRIHDR